MKHPEAYYEKWTRLRLAERRAYQKANGTQDNRDWQAWHRACRRLREHENQF